jgi:hypothetical protein
MKIINRIFAWLAGPKPIRSQKVVPAAALSVGTSRRLFATYLSTLNRGPLAWH